MQRRLRHCCWTLLLLLLPPPPPLPPLLLHHLLPWTAGIIGDRHGGGSGSGVGFGGGGILAAASPIDWFDGHDGNEGSGAGGGAGGPNLPNPDDADDFYVGRLRKGRAPPPWSDIVPPGRTRSRASSGSATGGQNSDKGIDGDRQNDNQNNGLERNQGGGGDDDKNNNDGHNILKKPGRWSEYFPAEVTAAALEHFQENVCRECLGQCLHIESIDNQIQGILFCQQRCTGELRSTAGQHTARIPAALQADAAKLRCVLHDDANWAAQRLGPHDIRSMLNGFTTFFRRTDNAAPVYPSASGAVQDLPRSLRRVPTALHQGWQLAVGALKETLLLRPNGGSGIRGISAGSRAESQSPRPPFPLPGLGGGGGAVDGIKIPPVVP